MIKEYVEKLINALNENLKEIFIGTFKVWLIFPVAIFIMYVLYLVIFGITEEGISKLFLLAIDVSLDWWIALFINLKKVVGEIILAFLISLNYYAFK